MLSQIMESINNDYCPGAFATKVMSNATSQWSLINTHKSHTHNITVTQQMNADCSERKLKGHYMGWPLPKPYFTWLNTLSLSVKWALEEVIS
jgi:hypothetical protein